MKFPRCIALFIAAISPALAALPEAGTSAAAPAHPMWHGADPSDRQLRKEIAQSQYERLLAGRFDELEKEAQRLAENPSQLRDGGTRLEAFYLPFSQRRWTKTPDWDAFKKQIDAWVAKNPGSDAANLAAAVFYIDFAWLARGTGTIGTVNDEMMKGFRERLEKAKGYLDNVKSPAFRQGTYWRGYVTLGMGLGTDKEELLPVVEKALAGKSDYRGDLLASTCVYLLPQWYGDDGDEWRQWLDKQTQAPGQEMDYAVAAYSATRYMDGPDGGPFGKNGADWLRMKNGFLALEAKYPQSSTIKSEILRVSWEAKDKDVARGVIERMQGAVEPGVLSRAECESIDAWLAQ